MKLTPEMQTELEDTARFLMEKGGKFAPETIEQARVRAMLMLENKYNPMVVQHGYQRVMGVSLLSPNPPVLNAQQNAAIAKFLALWCDKSVTSLSSAAVAAYTQNLKNVALLLITEHNASAGEVHSVAEGYGDTEWAQRFQQHLTADDDIDAAWASLQK